MRPESNCCFWSFGNSRNDKLLTVFIQALFPDTSSALVRFGEACSINFHHEVVLSEAPVGRVLRARKNRERQEEWGTEGTFPSEPDGSFTNDGGEHSFAVHDEVDFSRLFITNSRSILVGEIQCIFDVTENGPAVRVFGVAGYSFWEQRFHYVENAKVELNPNMRENSMPL